MFSLLCLAFSPMLAAAPAAPAAAPAAHRPGRHRTRTAPWPFGRPLPVSTYHFDARQPSYFENPHKPK